MRLFTDNSKEFDINNAKIQIIKNNPYYVLPEETKIYFGSKSPVFDNKPTFFGFDYKTAKKYGFVKTYTTNKKLHLLAPMELTTNHAFYKNADEDWKRKMKGMFDVGNITKYRYSAGDSDRKMMAYLCEQKMDGYAINGKYKGDEYGDTFDAELVLCNPVNDADLIDEEDHKVVSRTPPRLGTKKTKPEEEEEEEEYYSYDGTPVKGNHQEYSFTTPGGKGKNKKKKRNLRKSKKSEDQKEKDKKTKRKLRKSKKSEDQEEKDKYLFDAISSYDYDEVENALNNGANVNAQNNDGDTPLIHAINSGEYDVIELLLENGADVTNEELALAEELEEDDQDQSGIPYLIEVHIEIKKKRDDFLLKQSIVAQTIPKVLERQEDRKNLAMVMSEKDVGNVGDGTMPYELRHEIGKYLGGGKRRTRKSNKSKRKTRRK